MHRLLGLGGFNRFVFAARNRDGMGLSQLNERGNKDERQHKKQSQNAPETNQMPTPTNDTAGCQSCKYRHTSTLNGKNKNAKNRKQAMKRVRREAIVL